ncbi:helix-turn-helix domain of resolvase family protein [Enterobacter hormaechei]|nr:helix-turn-helix domain of resolvase family protein [Enterobacter hormaechei]
MGALAEMERELIVERTRAGLAVARAQGRIGGRRPKLSEDEWAQIGRLLAAGETRKRVALIFDVGISTLYRKFPASAVAPLSERSDTPV